MIFFSETEEAEAEDFMTKLAAETEVQATKIALNGNTGTVTKYPAITDNAIADLHPSITVKNHVPYIAWNSNSANDIFTYPSPECPVSVSPFGVGISLFPDTVFASVK